MHKFQISNGKVTYRNRHLNREAEHYIQAEGTEPGVALWNDPCGTLLGRAFSLFKQAGWALSLLLKWPAGVLLSSSGFSYGAAHYLSTAVQTSRSGSAFFLSQMLSV